MSEIVINCIAIYPTFLNLVLVIPELLFDAAERVDGSRFQFDLVIETSSRSTTLNKVNRLNFLERM